MNKDKVVNLKDSGLSQEEQELIKSNMGLGNTQGDPTVSPTVPELTPKQIKKQKIAEERYWKSMISRAECESMIQDMMQQLVKQTIAPIYDQMRLLFVQVSTISDVLVSKGLCTREELDAASKPLIEKLYPKSPVDDIPTEVRDTV